MAFNNWFMFALNVNSAAYFSYRYLDQGKAWRLALVCVSAVGVDLNFFCALWGL